MAWPPALPPDSGSTRGGPFFTIGSGGTSESIDSFTPAIAFSYCYQDYTGGASDWQEGDMTAAGVNASPSIRRHYSKPIDISGCDIIAFIKLAPNQDIYQDCSDVHYDTIGQGQYNTML